MTDNGHDPKRVDEATGTQFVGHEWDGIEELDTPMPRWWLWLFYITIAWGIVYVILYPAWPLIDRGTEGVLGWTSRGQLAQETQLADAEREEFRQQLVTLSNAELVENPDLMQQAVAGGRAAFKVNCVQCHGSGAAGSKGYPNLNDDDWLWGGDIDAIEYTIAHGAREPADNATRQSVMPGFDGIFQQAELDALVSHVQSLSGQGTSNAVGAELYAVNCVSCHGANGEGDRVQGAPNLADAIWLYGGSRAEITEQILRPRMGMMPKWDGRLDAATIKMLAAYVHSLGGGEDFEISTEGVESNLEEPSNDEQN